ncbi:MAG: 4'-phosphopantetheinyl transferase superfamily protein [Treponema sp.]|nr:4'-phosphopantetheinyl transferase superfamily protein [Treponema sp.]
MERMPAVYIGNIQSLKNEELFHKAYDSVSEYRQQKVCKMKHQEDKRRSLGAGLLLQKALSDFGIDEKTTAFETNSNGKPYISCSDKEAVQFNLSHSGDYAMCIIGDSPVGCDVERVRKIDLKLAERFFAQSEKEMISNQPTEDDKINTFFRLWTLKESYVKAEGQGLSIGLNSFAVQPDFNKILRDNVEVVCSLCEFDIDKAYRFSACVLNSEKGSQIKCRVVYIEDFHYI